MAGRITELAALTAPVSNDLIEVVDVSDTSMAATGTNKKLTLTTLTAITSTRTVYMVAAVTTIGTLGDAGAYLRFTGTNPTYEIPTHAFTAFPVGTQIDGVSCTTAMTLLAMSGVTINKARTLVTVGADSGWTAIKVDINEWDVHGDFV